MKKKLLVVFPILASISVYTISASIDSTAEIPQLECEYAGKFEQCMIANKNGSTRSIEDFVCIQSSEPEEVLDQIIFDVEFRKIEEEKILPYLMQLQEKKDAYVGQEGLLRAQDDITKNFGPEGVYYKEMKKLCNTGILAQRMECTEKVVHQEAGLRIKGSEANTECIELAKSKLDIYTQVSYDILKINKSEVLQDGHQKYVQEQRKKFEILFQNMEAIKGSAGRLAEGVTHWTEDPL